MSKSSPIYSIFLIDDEEDFCQALKATLEALGTYRVAYTTDPLSAESNPDFTRADAVITDLRMPDMSGEEIILKLRERPAGRERLILVISGIIPAETSFPIDPPVLVLPKPVDFQRLEALLREGLQNQRGPTS